MYIKIAEHIYKVINGNISSELINFIEENYKTISLDKNDKADFIIYLEDGYGDVFQNFDVIITDDENYRYYKRVDYLIELSLDFKSAKVRVHDILAFKHAMMNLYSAYIVHYNWGILLHSSCIVEESRAHIFTGHSGAGKSTVAKLSFPRALLSDEASIIKITDEEVTVFHSPFRSELSEKAEKYKYNLVDIQIIHQAKENKREKLSQLQGYLNLIDKVFFWTSDSNETIKIMNLLKKLSNYIDIYDLYFEKKPTFWEVMK